MKKIVILLLVFMTVSFAAFGHGGRNGDRHGHGYNDNYPLCVIDSCYEQGIHLHNNQYYSPHFFNDGHSYHEQCQINSCAFSVIHTHNGHHFFPRFYR